MAGVLGRTEEAQAYEKQRQAVIAATNRVFWNGSAYRDPGYKGETDDRAQGMAVVAGIAAPDKHPAIRRILAGSFHASPYIEKYILESLFQMNQPAEALQRMRTRYKEMVEAETSTLWELFSREGTLNHAWTGGPLTLMHEYVAGVVPTSPGYATYQVRPMTGGLSRIETGFDSVKGRIGLKIARQPDRFHLALESPAGTRATVFIPVAEHGLKAVRVGGTTVWLNGRPTGEVAGLEPGPQADGFATFIVGPGSWRFEAR